MNLCRHNNLILLSVVALDIGRHFLLVVFSRSFHACLCHVVSLFCLLARHPSYLLHKYYTYISCCLIYVSCVLQTIISAVETWLLKFGMLLAALNCRERDTSGLPKIPFSSSNDEDESPAVVAIGVGKPTNFFYWTFSGLGPSVFLLFLPVELTRIFIPRGAWSDRV